MPELFGLLDQASRRTTPYVPDVEGLLDTARGRARRRHLITATSVVAAVAIASTGVSALLAGGDATTDQPAAPQTTPTPAKKTASARSAQDIRIARECQKVNGGRDNISPWRVVLSLTDASGTSAALQSPDGKRYAACVFMPAQWQNGSEASVVVGRTAARPKLPKNWRDGFMPINWTYNCNLKRSDTCPHESWSGAALLPADATRVTVRIRRNGPPVDARVANGYLVFRRIQPYQAITANSGSGAGPMPPVIITMYDASGKRLTSYDQNYLPPISGCPTQGGC